jgi:hypothetical protein
MPNPDRAEGLLTGEQCTCCLQQHGSPLLAVNIQLSASLTVALAL